MNSRWIRAFVCLALIVLLVEVNLTCSLHIHPANASGPCVICHSVQAAVHVLNQARTIGLPIASTAWDIQSTIWHVPDSPVIPQRSPRAPPREV